MTNYVQYKDPTDTAGFPSSIIWADCPTVELMHDPGKGFHHFDDFRGYTETATGVGNSSGHPVFEGNTTMTQVASGTSGSALAIFTTDDNQEASLQLGRTGIMNIPASGGGKLWFEARIKKSSISEGNVFIGLAAAEAAVADFIVDASNDFSDVSLFGFASIEGDPDVFDVVYQDPGTGVQTPLGDAVTLTADTYVKLGFVYDPSEDPDKRIKIYVDAVEQSTYITAALMAATEFPAGDAMVPTIHVKGFSNNDFTATLDWWRAAYIR